MANMNMHRSFPSADIGLIGVFLLMTVRIAAATLDDVFTWGEEKNGVRLGIRIEKIESPGTDLFSFTTVAINSTDKPLRLATGDSWNGPIVPHYVFSDGKSEWKISPPHVAGIGPGITHIPRPRVTELKSKTLTVLHKCAFVPPLSRGEWSVTATLNLSGGKLDAGAREQLTGKGVWMSGYFVSGKLTLTLENDRRPLSGKNGVRP